jgi:hypothetical protein
MDELEIQNGFVAWLATTRGYKEVFSDPNGGSGAKCDSIGFVAPTSGMQLPILIEFKTVIKKNQIAYSPNASSSIERKICESLRDLHSNKLECNWKKDLTPLVWIVAESIPTESRKLLCSMLVQRAQEWLFNYEFGEWSGTTYKSVGTLDIGSQSKTSFYHVQLPYWPWPGEKRELRSTIDDFRQIARAKGVGTLFDFMIKLARQNRLSMRCNRESLNLQALDSTTGKRVNIISIWPSDSGNKGLCIASNRLRIQSCFPVSDESNPCPGKPAESRGYLGERRYLSSERDITEYWSWVISR